MNITRLTLLTLSLGLLMGLPTVNAQDRGELALKYADNLAENRAKLSQYTWQLRVEVLKNGEMQYVDLLEATIGQSGQLETVEINNDLQIKKRHGIIRGNLQDATQDNIAEKVAQVKEWANAYVYMSRGKVVDFFDAAQVSEAAGWDNAVVAQKLNVLVPGDSVTLVADKDSLMPLHLTFLVPNGKKKAVAARIEFRVLRDNGAFVASRAHAVWEGDNQIEILVDSFDFMKQL